jgi:acyl-CoA thioester hydrolase
MINKKQISIRWSDLDPNFHLRHSVFYDFAAQQRVEILSSIGLTMSKFQEMKMGPVIFREEANFRREIKMGDNITLEVYLSKMSADGTKWSFEHRFVNDAGKLMATLHVDGSWIDIVARRLYKDIPQELLQSFIDFPRTDNFEMLS